ncbi:hypothetical protein ACSLOH_30170, partial [Escherichia coli]
IIVTRLDSLSENLAVQTMLPAFYEQGYDPIMMESQFSPQLVASRYYIAIDATNIIGFSLLFAALFSLTGGYMEPDPTPLPR